MLLVSRSLRASLYVPVAYHALTGAMVLAATGAALDHPSLGAAVGWLVSVAFFAFVVSMIVVTHVDGDRLLVRSPFGAVSSCAHAHAAIGFRVFTGTKGGHEYTIQASDGSMRLDLATAWTRRGAMRDVRRLEEVLALHASPTREAGRADMAAAVDAWDRQQAEAKAFMAAQYASPRTWWTALAIVAVFGLVYAVVMAFVVLGR